MVKFSFGNTATLPTPKTKTKKRASHGTMRPAILSYIKEHPGCTAQELYDAMGTSSHSIDNYLWHMLHKSHEVTVAKKTRPYQYSIAKASGVKIAPQKRTKLNRATAILAFVKEHEGQSYSYQTLSQGTSIPYGSIFAEVAQLKQKGVLDKNFNRPEEVVEPKQESAVSINSIEFLVWQYVKATRSTDVLGFLTWIENR